MTVSSMKRIPSLLLPLVLSGLLAVLFHPFFLELNAYWRDERESSYVFLIPLFSAYFIWVQRDKFRRLPTKEEDRASSTWGLVLLTCGLLLFIAGRYTYVLFVEAFAFVVIMAGAVLFILGKGLFRLTLVPILFLLFMLPIPFPLYYAVAGPLKYFIAEMAAALLSLFNIPVFLEGNVIQLSSISLLVHETCSGLRTVISLLAISTAFAYLFLRSYAGRAAVIGAAVLVGVFVNVLRIFAIGLLSYMYDSSVAMGFHKYAWSLVTPVGVAAIFLIGFMLRWLEERRDT